MAWFQTGTALLNGRDIISPWSASFTKLLKTRHADSERDS
jgi:hypothetical protein